MMIEMVRGKSSTTGCSKSPSSPTMMLPKTISSRDDQLPKRKSRSPSPTIISSMPKFGQTETLQRENIMRMRKQQQLEKHNQENGCRTERLVKPSDRPTAKKSINPRKLCAAQTEIIQELKAKQQAEITNEILPLLPTPEKLTDHKISNGTVTNCNHDKPALPNDDGAGGGGGGIFKKMKIDVEFEDSDEDDEENEGLKKVMENIEKDLNVAEDIKKGVMSKRPDGPIAPINASWLEFGCREFNKRKKSDTHIKSLMPFLVMVENEMMAMSRTNPASEKDSTEGNGEEAITATSEEDATLVEELAKENPKSKDIVEGAEVKLPEQKVCDGNVDEKDEDQSENQKTMAETAAVPQDDLQDVQPKVQRLDETINLDDTPDQDSIPKVEDKPVTADTKEEDCDKDSGPVQTEELPDVLDAVVTEKGCANASNDVEKEEHTDECEQAKTSVEVESEEPLHDGSNSTMTTDCKSTEPVISDAPGIEVEATGDEHSMLEADKAVEPCEKNDGGDTTIQLDDSLAKDNDDDEKIVVEDVEVTIKNEDKVVDLECEVECSTKRKREAENAKKLETMEPVDKKLKLDEKADTGSQPVKEKSEDILEKDTKDSYPVVAANEASDQKKKEKVYRLTKAELEMLVICKVTEFFSDANKSEIGALRRRCEQLEKLLDQSRKKTTVYQKQVSDLQIAVQRMQVNKRFPHPPKPLMRSVGLQVQLTRYIPADPTKLVSRVTTLGVQGNKAMMVSNVQGHPTIQGQQVVLPKQVAGGQLALVTNLGAAGALNGATLVSKSPAVSHLGSTTTVNTVGTARSRTSSSSVIGSRSPISVMKSPGAQIGVSLLPPKTSTISPSLVIAGTISGSTQTSIATTRMPLLTASAPTSALRTALDPPKMNATSSATPIPMRLVPNQAVARQLNSTVATSTSSPSNINVGVNTPRTVTVSMVGQPAVVTSGVKIIDLTADEEDANAQLKGLQTMVAGTAGTISSSISSANSFSNVAVVSSALTASSNTVTVLAPSTVSGVSSGQIFTLNAGQPVTAMVSGANTLTSPSSIRMTTPLRTSTGSLVNSGPVRLAYLMPSTSMVTMVRPNQPVFVAPAGGVRPGQPGLVRPNVPTFVLQRGTALVPLQQGQVTSLPSVRPAALAPQLSRLSTSTGTVPVSVVNSTATIRPSVSSPSVTSTSLVGGSAIVSSSTPTTITYSRSSVSASSVQSNLNVKTVLTPQPALKHPAPLPLQPTYSDAAQVGRKALPPKPALKISKVTNGIVLSWNMCLSVAHAEIASYQLYAYQEGSSLPSTSLWKKVGDVKALPLPMACTLTQFMEGNKYYFAVRAIDVHQRFGQFSDPGSIALISTAAVKQSPTKS